MGTVAIFQSLNEGDEKTELWHCRLGYTSEKGMSVISKQGQISGKATKR